MRKLMSTNVARLVLLACAVTLIFTSCDPDDGLIEDTEQINQLRLLAGDWTLANGAGSIVVDGTDVSANYEGFSLFYTNGFYLTTNADELFRARGTWEWIDENGTMVRLDDGKEITIVQLTDRRFTFTFNLANGGSRAGIPGNYTISVVR